MFQTGDNYLGGSQGWEDCEGEVMATITVKCTKCKQPVEVAVWANGKGTSLWCQCGKKNSC